MGILLAAAGFMAWTGPSSWGGPAEADSALRLHSAWDVPAYFYVGVPVMAAAVALASFMRPERAWRWPLWLVGGHQLGVMVIGLGMQSGLSLILLTIILGILLAAGFAVPAMLGAMAARAMAERAY
jgi:uncharacterized protein (DUF983 family)